jgi:hypothetical protein
MVLLSTDGWEGHVDRETGTDTVLSSRIQGTFTLCHTARPAVTTLIQDGLVSYLVWTLVQLN